MAEKNDRRACGHFIALPAHSTVFPSYLIKHFWSHFELIGVGVHVCLPEENIFLIDPIKNSWFWVSIIWRVGIDQRIRFKLNDNFYKSRNLLKCFSKIFILYQSPGNHDEGQLWSRSSDLDYKSCIFWTVCRYIASIGSKAIVPCTEG